MGGTQRLEPVSPEHAAVAKKDVAKQETEKKAIETRKRPAPTVDMPAAMDETPKPAALPAPSDGQPSTLALLFAPASVAVGLVFFAMGSMIALVAEGRLIRFTIAAPVETVSATPPSATAGPTHTAALPATSPTPPPVTAPTTSPPVVSTGKHATPPASARPQGTGKRPPIIF